MTDCQVMTKHPVIVDLRGIFAEAMGRRPTIDELRASGRAEEAEAEQRRRAIAVPPEQ
jgi:hypothetical protein